MPEPLLLAVLLDIDTVLSNAKCMLLHGARFPLLLLLLLLLLLVVMLPIEGAF
jgi:hypothetical protein